MKLTFAIFLLLSLTVSGQPKPAHNLHFDSLTTRWDDGIPLGNGMLGALTWKKGGKLHISLDRADLWDERPALHLNKFNYKWVQQQVRKKEYDTVQKLGDRPYEDSVFPTKIPAGALEFNITAFGAVVSNTLDIARALNTIKFKNGTVCNVYVHAEKQAGFFGFENLPPGGIIPDLIQPAYTSDKGIAGENTVPEIQLQTLGYANGSVKKTAKSILYHQPAWGANYYEIYVEWKQMSPTHIIGAWTISYNKPANRRPLLMPGAEPTGWARHSKWWNDFWSRSSVSVPDSQLEKQYYLEMYKLGCVSRKGAPAITLQAIWTADNGSVPPWKGDFHNDLNTQLSYWPCYVSNHLVEAASFTDWLWAIRKVNKQYTKQFFGVDGLAVPGVATIHGYPMGGWIQYSLSPTVAAWVAQHFYWEWKYSMNKDFLLNRAYPYLHEVAEFLSNITYVENGTRKIPLSTSPEYNDNNLNAWFSNWTNYDLALAKFLFSATAEACDSAGKKEEAKKWTVINAQLPGYSINETGLEVGEGQNLDVSHRHLSPYMAIYPLGLLNFENEQDRNIIASSLHHIEQKGTGEWCGYSFAWMASVYAAAKMADSACAMLKIFASDFCSINSFHLNGDQKGGLHSNFTYRPFTLEGNFAFAQGVHEMLLESRQGHLEVFPAVPDSWKDVAFSNFRTEGAFLISAQKKNGMATLVKVQAAHTGQLKIKLPFDSIHVTGSSAKYTFIDRVFTVPMQKGQTLLIRHS